MLQNLELEDYCFLGENIQYENNEHCESIRREKWEYQKGWKYEVNG